MRKRELDLLGKAFNAEIDSAINKGIGLFQTKSKLAEKLENDGLLKKETIILDGKFPVKIEGYSLTHAGRMTYCMSCD
jgi:hypothetical protein